MSVTYTLLGIETFKNAKNKPKIKHVDFNSQKSALSGFQVSSQTLFGTSLILQYTVEI